MPINMKRKNLPDTTWENPSLLFDKGFKTWVDDNAQRGEAIGSHLNEVCKKSVPAIYKKAYQRWLGMTAGDHFAHWFGQLEGRLLIGLGNAHVLETHVSRQSAYGMPIISGSALKGLARSVAESYGIRAEEADILFGKTGDTPESMESGYLIFHDAWWIPNGGSTDTPYVRDIVTVHATEYYKTQGKTDLHPDMESPNPNHQLAVQGSFYFAIEGLQSWADLGMKILTQALKDEGIGGKIAAGYGYFKQDEHADKQAKKLIKIYQENITQRNESKQKQQQAADESAKVLQMSEAEQITYTLEQCYTEYQQKLTPNKQDKESLNSAVNRVLNQGAGWTASERKIAGEMITQCYAKTIPAKKRKKKLEKLQIFIEGIES